MCKCGQVYRSHGPLLVRSGAGDRELGSQVAPPPLGSNRRASLRSAQTDRSETVTHLVQLRTCARTYGMQDGSDNNSARASSTVVVLATNDNALFWSRTLPPGFAPLRDHERRRRRRCLPKHPWRCRSPASLACPPVPPSRPSARLNHRDVEPAP